MELAFKKRRYWPRIAVAALLVALMASPALADFVWNGPNPNTNWSTPGNWIPTGPPTAGTDVFLTSTTSKTATLNTKAPATGSFVHVWNDASSGTFTVNQSSSTTSLSASGEIIGYTATGKGIYNQSGGSNTITNALVLGIGGPGSSGTYKMTGGKFSAGAVVVGPYGTGTFTQSSTTVNIGDYYWDTEPYSLIVGGEFNGGPPNSYSGTGTYTNSSGTLNIAGGAAIGQNGSGTFTQSSGKTSIGGNLDVGNHPGSIGKFTMSSGTLNVKGNEYIGDGDPNGAATGTFSQSAGTHTIGGDLVIGNWDGSTGTFTMSSGTLKVTDDEFIGDYGTGTFTQSAGNHTIGGALLVGASGGSGTFTMKSGSLTVGGPELIGYFGPGTFNQTSGSNTAGGDFILGVINTGTYTMTSGSLLVKGTTGEYIGDIGSGTFNQTSGSNSVTNGQLTLAAQDGSSGTYNITSGSVSAPHGITINGSQSPVGSQGTGTFNVLGSAGVTGPVTNYGTVNVGTTTPSASVTWNNTFTNYNAYNAGNATGKGTTNTFVQDLVVQPTGYINAETPLKVGPNALTPYVPQDIFIFQGNFDNESASSSWNTVNAEMEFVKGASNAHTLNISSDGSVAGHPFAWYQLALGPGQTLNLTGNANAAQWLNLLTGVGITAKGAGQSLTNVFNASTNSLSLYYDTDIPSMFALFGGFDYTIPAAAAGDATGILYAHAPIPPSALLLGSGLLGMGLLGWRRKRLMG